jgi:hypothetical protein
MQTNGYRIVSEHFYAPAVSRGNRKLARQKKDRPNRIFELTKARHWTYAEVAERVRAIAKARGDAARAKVHEVTINRLSIGKAQLTQQWMELLGEVYSVPATDLISSPVAQNMRLVRVTCSLESGAWTLAADLPIEKQYEIMIPQDRTLDSLNLYAGEINGPGSDARYSEKSIVILSKITQTPGEIIEGRRYHVRATRADGTIENTIKTLVVDPNGAYWLKPESNHPMHQEWYPIGGKPGLLVEIIGRVRGVFFRED